MIRKMAEDLDLEPGIVENFDVPEYANAEEWQKEAWAYFQREALNTSALRAAQKLLDEKFGPGKYEITYADPDVEEPLVRQFLRTR